MPKPLWVGFYHALSDCYGDADPNYLTFSNCTWVSTPEEARRARQPILCAPLAVQGEPCAPIMGVYTEGGSAAALEDITVNRPHPQLGIPPLSIARAVHAPIWGCCDGFLPSGRIRGIDVLGLEAYAIAPFEAPADVIGRLKASLSLLPPDQPVFLIAQAYDRKTGVGTWMDGYRGDALELLTLTMGLALTEPRVIGVFGFSWRRLGGIITHPSYRYPFLDLLSQTCVPGTQVAVPAPTAPALPTGVTILYPGPTDIPQLSPTSTTKLIEFQDPTLPDRVYRVDLVNSSVHAQISTPSGQRLARSGKLRPVQFL